MSLRLKSELRLRLGPRRCTAELWRAGLSKAPALAVAAEGEGPLVGQALARLVSARAALPRRAHLVVADECLYYALLPSDAGWGSGEANARRYFQSVLPALKLHVAVTLSPCGNFWLAVAVEAALVETARQALAAHGIALARVDAALLQDLDRVARRMPASAAVAVVRDAGVVLLQREQGSWTGLAWQRCDGWQAEAVAAQVEAQLFRRRRRQPEAAAETPPVLLVAQHEGQAGRLAGVARARGWELLTLPVLPAPAEAAP